MLTTLANPTDDTTHAPQRAHWRPPALLMRYQIVKLVGAAFFVVIFTGWLWLQWSNPTMRIVAGGLLLATIWFTYQSHSSDARRSFYKIAIADGKLEIEGFDANHAPVAESIPLSEIDHAEWTEGDPAASFVFDDGLRLVARDGSLLALVGTMWIADQAEARALANWIRSTTHHPFEVRWPATQ